MIFHTLNGRCDEVSDYVEVRIRIPKEVLYKNKQVIVQKVSDYTLIP